MTSILHLPPEITGYIVERLSPGDLFCLRQTCHTLNNNTLHIFSKDYFHMRRVMLDRRSLEALAGIAEHPTLGPCVQEVEVSTNHLLPLDELRTIEPPSRPFSEIMAWADRRARSEDENAEEGEEEAIDEEREDEGNISAEEADSDDDDYPHLRGLDETAYRKAFDDQEELIRRGDDIKHLTRAMQKLVNCSTIRITDDNRVWGLRRLKKEIGILPQRCLTFESPKSVELVRQMLHALFAALAEGNTPIDFLEITSGSVIENANRISPDMLVKPTSAALDNFRLHTLTTLSLILDSKSPEHSATSIDWSYDLIQFLNRFPELSEFRIEFAYRDEDRGSLSGSPEWRSSGFNRTDYATYTRFSKLSQLLFIPKLDIVHLATFDCTGMELALFLLRHQSTLQDIHLDSIVLVDADGEIGSWLWLLKVIRDAFQKITSFIIDNCIDSDIRSLLSLKDKHYYYNPMKNIIETTSSKGLDTIIMHLSKEDI